MKTFNKYYTITIISFFILFSGCIKDNITPPLTSDLNPVAEMLIYFEEQGDFVNSPLAPALIGADEVYANLSSYLVIDIRQPSVFTEGHIEGSINIQPDSLFGYFENLNSGEYSKIILVSKNGQSSAYFTCLLRLAGFYNVYTMNFGLAYWNEFFADEWFNAIGDALNIWSFTNDAKPKNDFTPLPEVTFDNPDAPIEERIKERIKKVFSEGFHDRLQYRAALRVSDDDYFVCYGIPSLYYARLKGPGHNAAAIFYLSGPYFDFRTQRYLQTLPTAKNIIIYDENGQAGACIAAYLRVLGYSAQTLLFGGNQIIYYNRMKSEPDLIPFAFDYMKIKNYPYITGG